MVLFKVFLLVIFDLVTVMTIKAKATQNDNKILSFNC